MAILACVGGRNLERREWTSPPPCLRPQLRRLKVWGWLDSWGLESSGNLFTCIFDTWVRRTWRLGQPAGVFSCGLPVGFGFLRAWKPQASQTSHLLAQRSNDDCPPWTGWHRIFLYSQAPGVTQLHFQHTLLGTVSHKLPRFKNRRNRPYLSLGRIPMNLKICFKIATCARLAWLIMVKHRPMN